MKIAVLTSSRADYGIYLPLLQKLKADADFDLKIIAFGTHLSDKYGRTIRQILEDGFEVVHKLETAPGDDTPAAIAASIGRTIEKFSAFWSKYSKDFDLVFCLGDRYEMFAAVAASVPFNVQLAHIHGGESTLGAIDDKFRHAITIMSHVHFTALEAYKEKVMKLTGSDNNVYTVGALSLDNLNELSLLNKEQFKDKYGIDLSIPTVLVTFHPETVAYKKNVKYSEILVLALREMGQQIIITMPNADTMGIKVREVLNNFIDERENAYGIESFGTLDYFSCMQHCSFLLGNTSSGIVEAASFGKFVINLGDRQKGRIVGENVFHCPIKKEQILEMVEKVKRMGDFKGKNIYGQGETSDRIVKMLKEYS